MHKAPPFADDVLNASAKVVSSREIVVCFGRLVSALVGRVRNPIVALLPAASEELIAEPEQQRIRLWINDVDAPKFGSRAGGERKMKVVGAYSGGQVDDRRVALLSQKLKQFRQSFLTPAVDRKFNEISCRRVGIRKVQNAISYAMFIQYCEQCSQKSGQTKSVVRLSVPCMV